jgi:glycosyltransferase involved in cell wall biosynthesis
MNGIIVTTYNSLELIKGCIDAIETHTPSDYELLICVDGTENLSVTRWLEDNGYNYIIGERGLPARNRNRGLLYWKYLGRWDAAVIMDDDSWPCKYDWFQVWIETAMCWGHVAWTPDASAPDGSPEYPNLKPNASGSIVAMTDKVRHEMGYNHPMWYHRDPSEGCIGEDIAWLRRVGFLLNAIYSLRYGIHHSVLPDGTLMPGKLTTHDKEGERKSVELFHKRLDMNVFQPAWLDSEQRDEFTNELQQCLARMISRQL